MALFYLQRHNYICEEKILPTLKAGNLYAYLFSPHDLSLQMAYN